MEDIQKQNRVISACLSQSLYYQSRPTSDVGPPMTTDFRLVADTTKRNALEWTIEGFGN